MYDRTQNLLIGTVILVMGIGVMATFGKLTTLECKRIEPRLVACDLITSSMLGKHVTPISTGELLGAEVEINSDSDGDSFRIVLGTQHGKIPFTDYYSSARKQKAQTADQINVFINTSTEASLKVYQDDRWFAYPFGIIFAVVGACIIFLPIEFTESTD
jgi:hypothetical protein